MTGLLVVILCNLVLMFTLVFTVLSLQTSPGDTSPLGQAQTQIKGVATCAFIFGIGSIFNTLLAFVAFVNLSNKIDSFKERFLMDGVALASFLRQRVLDGDYDSHLTKASNQLANNLLAGAITAGMKPTEFYDTIRPLIVEQTLTWRTNPIMAFYRIFGTTLRTVNKTGTLVTSQDERVKPNAAWEKWFLDCFRLMQDMTTGEAAESPPEDLVVTGEHATVAGDVAAPS